LEQRISTLKTEIKESKDHIEVISKQNEELTNEKVEIEKAEQAKP
jgi:septal ring factor EnvC (AmiA/AmiB activator)